MNLDDKVCYCFHVSRRKLVNWSRMHEPKVASQLSMCGGAGTGFGTIMAKLAEINAGRAKQRHVLEFTTQLAVMIRAGISIRAAIDAVVEVRSRRGGRRRLRTHRRDLRRTGAGGQPGHAP